MSHLGLRKFKHHWEADAPTTSNWCGFWYVDIIGPFFFENEQGAAVSVIDERYRAILNEFLFPKLEEDDMDDIWLQQDGATYHTANVIVDLLRTVFENRIISRNSDVNWPPRSCDLTPLKYFCGKPLRISVTLTIQRRLRLCNHRDITDRVDKLAWNLSARARVIRRVCLFLSNAMRVGKDRKNLPSSRSVALTEFPDWRCHLQSGLWLVDSICNIFMFLTRNRSCHSWDWSPNNRKCTEKLGWSNRVR